jgi:MinD-like ATPase involved in chromosome partitioning or flagellar assembly
VLLSPAAATADAALPIQWENLGKAVEACREPYRYVVIDAPRLPQRMAADLAAVSRLVVVVFQLNIRDISFAKSTIAFLRNQGMAPDKILPVANRVNRRGQLLKLQEGRDAIGMKSLCSLRSDWRKAIKSLNQGQPLASVAARSRLRRDFYKLALRIHKGT